MKAKNLQIIRYFDKGGWYVISRNYKRPKRVYKNITRASLGRLSTLTYSHDTHSHIGNDVVDVYIHRKRNSQ